MLMFTIYVSCRWVTWVLFCASFSYLLIIYKISILNRYRRYFANIESISNRNWNPDIKSSLLWIKYRMRIMTLQQCQVPADAVCYFHSPGGSTCLHELTLQQLSARNDVMAAVLKFWGQIKNLTLHARNNCAKCHPEPIWNDGALGFFTKWCHGCHLESMTSHPKPHSINRYKEQSCQISSWSDLKWQSLRLFWKRSPQEKVQAQEQDE